MLTAMGVLAVLMLVDNPLLSYHSGYLLSFFSVCGVGLLVPILTPTGQGFIARPWDSKFVILLKSIWGRAVSGLAVSCSVTLFTLPIQFFFFYIHKKNQDLMQIPLYSGWGQIPG
jgi:competence protein ComEC